MRFLLFIPIVIFWLIPLVGHGAAAKINWQEWKPALFERAEREGKLVLLDLEAVWCHWCHVMEQETYGDAEVVKKVTEGFIPVKVDQDARPDLARRYRNYAWPATIIFTAKRKELLKRRGYIPPDTMVELLQAVKRAPDEVLPDDATSVASYNTSPLLGASTREALRQDHLQAYDADLGSLNMAMKYLDLDSVTYDLRLAQQGNQAARLRLNQTLEANLALMDPVWGGVYQYSHGYDWQHPHYEKIMRVQADNLKIYSWHYGFSQDEKSLATARSIYEYLHGFLLSSEGGFYNSQDADLIQGTKAHDYFSLNDSERRQRGMPSIDTNRYARENGWAIEALAQYYGATGDERALQDALRGANWVMAHRGAGNQAFAMMQLVSRFGINPAGAFFHGTLEQAGDENPFYLGDTLAMAQAFLALYEVTADVAWLQRAETSMSFLDRSFRDVAAPGYFSALAGGVLTPVKTIDENLSVTRLANRLFDYTGRSSYENMSQWGMRYLATPTVARSRFTEAGILLAEAELANDPTHLTVVGPKYDKKAAVLFQEALAYPTTYRRVEWWDPKSEPLPRMDVAYPKNLAPAAFVCLKGFCSRPIFDAQELREAVGRLQAGPQVGVNSR